MASPQYPNIYFNLKQADPGNAAAMIAAAAQAAQWDRQAVVQFARLIGADQGEVDAIVRQARASKEAGAPWLPIV